MKRIFLSLAVVVVPSSCFAAVLDQENLPTNTAFSVFSGTTIWQQEMIAGMDGQLVGVEYFIPLNGAAADSRHRFGVSVGEPWHWEDEACGQDFSSVQTVTFLPTSSMQSTWMSATRVSSSTKTKSSR